MESKCEIWLKTIMQFWPRPRENWPWPRPLLASLISLLSATLHSHRPLLKPHRPKHAVDSAGGNVANWRVSRIKSNAKCRQIRQIVDLNCRKNTEFYAQSAKKRHNTRIHSLYTYLLQATRSMELTKRQTDKIQTRGAKRSV